jgi:hypothetical protein
MWRILRFIDTCPSYGLGEQLVNATRVRGSAIMLLMQIDNLHKLRRGTLADNVPSNRCSCMSFENGTVLHHKVVRALIRLFGMEVRRRVSGVRFAKPEAEAVKQIQCAFRMVLILAMT